MWNDVICTRNKHVKTFRKFNKQTTDITVLSDTDITVFGIKSSVQEKHSENCLFIESYHFYFQWYRFNCFLESSPLFYNWFYKNIQTAGLTVRKSYALLFSDTDVTVHGTDTTFQCSWDQILCFQWYSYELTVST